MFAFNKIYHMHKSKITMITSGFYRENMHKKSL